MNKNLDLLKKLIKNTKNGEINWIKSRRPEDGWLSLRDNWKGETKLTKDKTIMFVLSYCVPDITSTNIYVYFIDLKKNNREIIWYIEPGIFSFRTENNIKKLIKLLNKKEINGPPKPINKNWEEINIEK